MIDEWSNGAKYWNHAWNPMIGCRKAQVPVFVKQLDINGKLVKDIEKFPEDLQIRQVPWK